MTPAQDFGVEAVKVTPPAAVAAASFAGMTVEQWVAVLTLIYVAGLVAHQIPRHWQAIQAGWRRFQAWRRERSQ